MKAAVVSSFGTDPRYEEFPSPTAAGDHGTVIDVIAAGLHPRVRSQANGSHYTSTGELPLVPGIDGVGRGADGLLRYFILPDTTMGAMATDRHRPPAQHRPARGQRPHRGRCGHEPGHVLLGRAAPAGAVPGRAERPRPRGHR